MIGAVRRKNKAVSGRQTLSGNSVRPRHRAKAFPKKKLDRGTVPKPFGKKSEAVAPCQSLSDKKVGSRHRAKACPEKK
jgi:hypothetical protein